MRKNLTDQILNLAKTLNEEKDMGRGLLREKFLNHDNSIEIHFPKTSSRNDDSQIIYQKWMFNGFIINGPDLKLCVDPGVDFLTRCSYSNIDLTKIEQIFLSHSHLDHYSSINIVTEQMELGDRLHDATIILSQVAINSKVISDYHRGEGRNVQPKISIMHESEQIHLGTLSKITPIALYHSISGSFGFILQIGSFKIGYTGDTGYATKINVKKKVIDVQDIKEPIYEIVHIEEYRETLKSAFADCDFLIANINSLEYNKHSKTHLTVQDVIHIIHNSRLKRVVLAHLPIANKIQEELAALLAAFITSKTGVMTESVLREGLKINLELPMT